MSNTAFNLSNLCVQEIAQNRKVMILLPGRLELVEFREALEKSCDPTLANRLSLRSSQDKHTLRSVDIDTLVVVNRDKCDFIGITIARTRMTHSGNSLYIEVKSWV